MMMDVYPDSLTKSLESGGLWTESATLDVVSGLFAAIAHLHSRGVVHRDVKLENILLDEHKKPVLCDFGFCVSIHDTDLMKVKCGTPGYMAPEMVSKPGTYDEKVDVFAGGVVHYALISKTVPFASEDLVMSLQRTLRCTPKFKEPSWLRISAETQALIRLLLTKNPADRPTSAEALEKIEVQARNMPEHCEEDGEFTDDGESASSHTVTSVGSSTRRPSLGGSGIEAVLSDVGASGSGLRTAMVPECPKAPRDRWPHRRVSNAVPSKTFVPARDGINIRPPSQGCERHDPSNRDDEDELPPLPKAGWASEGSRSSVASSLLPSGSIAAENKKDSGDSKDGVAPSRGERYRKAMGFYDANAEAITGGRRRGLTSHQQRVLPSCWDSDRQDSLSMASVSISRCSGMSGSVKSGRSSRAGSTSSAASSAEGSIASMSSVMDQHAETTLQSGSRLPSIANASKNDIEQPLTSRRAFSKGGHRPSRDSRLVQL